MKRRQVEIGRVDIRQVASAGLNSCHTVIVPSLQRISMQSLNARLRVLVNFHISCERNLNIIASLQETHGKAYGGTMHRIYRGAALLLHLCKGQWLFELAA
jgi:hypothetical protein